MPKPTASSKLLIGLFSTVLLLLVMFAVVLWCLIPQATDRGLFGDMFGAVNALFSGLAFAGIVYTIHMQRIESAFNAAAAERSARLSAMSVLVAAYSERARFLEAGASPELKKVEGIHASLKQLIVDLQEELAHSSAA